MSNKERNNVFSIRNFRLVFFGALVSELGTSLYSFAVGFYILKISANNAFLQGLYLAVCGVVLLLFTPVGGVLGDRFNKARIMFICDYLKGGMILLATLLMLMFRENSIHIVILFAAGILGNAVSGIFNPASHALLPYIVEEEKLQQGNSYFSMKNALVNIFGILLAGVLYAAMPIQQLFFIVGICYVLSGVSEMFIRYESIPKEDKLTFRSALGDMQEGLVYLKTQKAIIALVVATLFINFFLTPVFSNFVPYFVSTDVAGAPSYLFREYLKPELWSSVFIMLIGLSSLVGSLIYSTLPPKDKCGYSTALRTCGMAAVLIAATIAYWQLVACGRSLNAFLIFMSFGSFLMGLLLVFINIPLSTMMMRIVDKEKISKVSSLTSMASQGLIPIASVMAGIVLQWSGITMLLALCSAGLLATALSMLFSKEIRKI